MKSQSLPSFWRQYHKLEQKIKIRTKKSYQLWAKEPFHPTLHFKCINKTENIWSVRISQGYRALALLDQDTATWFWIGNHDKYERFFG